MVEKFALNFSLCEILQKYRLCIEQSANCLAIYRERERRRLFFPPSLAQTVFQPRSLGGREVRGPRRWPRVNGPTESGNEME